MNVLIKIPKVEDLEKVNKLAKQVHKLHVQWRPDIFLDIEDVIDKEYFIELIKEERIFVAILEEEIVGYVIFSINEKDSRGIRHRKILSIEVICVDKENRGKGIGTLLLNYAKKIGKKSCCTDMYLTVNEENKNAIKTYEKFGFRVKNISYSMRI